MPAKKKVVKKKTTKTAKKTTAEDKVKHIKVSFLNSAADVVSVRIGQTLQSLMEARGISNNDFTEIIGVKGNDSENITAATVIDGYEEIVFVPNGGGGAEEDEESVKPEDE